MTNGILTPATIIIVMCGMGIVYQVSSKQGAFRHAAANFVVGTILIIGAAWTFEQTRSALLISPQSGAQQEAISFVTTLARVTFWGVTAVTAVFLGRTVWSSLRIPMGSATIRSTAIRMWVSMTAIVVITLLAHGALRMWGVRFAEENDVLTVIFAGLVFLNTWAGMIYVIGYTPSSETKG